MLQPVRFSRRNTIQMGEPADDEMCQLQFDICRAIDLNHLSGIFDRMMDRGMSPEMRKILETQADLLRATMLTEKNRLFQF